MSSVTFRPPPILVLLFCRECGRDDRYTPFTGKSHWRFGKRCSGTPVQFIYEAPVSVSGGKETRR